MDRVPTANGEGGDSSQTVVQVPVDVRSVSLAVLAVLASIVVLRWAADVFIPLLVGMVFSYALSPVVDRLVRWRVPRTLAAAVVVFGLVAALLGTAASLRDDAEAVVDSLPAIALKLRRAVRGDQAGTLHKVRQAAAEIEQVAQAAQSDPPRPPRGVQRVVVEPRQIDVGDFLWTGTVGLATFVVQAVVVCFITFFTLASGDTFRRKLVKIAGPTITKKKLTVQMLDEITEQIQRYLLVQVATSVLVGVSTGIAFHWLGLEHAAVWGAVAGVLNLIPYLGAIVITAGAAVVGFVQFSSIEMALAVGGASLAIQVLEGYLLTPWLTSRASRMSPVVVFVSVLVFGWMWGAWGLLLGVPIVMAVKAVCDRVDDLKPVGELLGR